ncbi:hypothetical protein JL107_02485 [Nakamurella flavida]|uniref:ADP-dependent phosphofructokinase/glucokinase n=1 Tax=Nakamurella flavida TaxID=363630 RepID=A0A939C449_9ACTN|nr:ADP-dependent glucokinase/phosphofructokinase [Nakamurella flavida]MBM9475304.1 hypothetical protein [Nakamurella flavida]MDP9776878.1 ADP-dependent phosphofructokinase/glucokinase [Nakamurella flavida]
MGGTVDYVVDWDPASVQTLVDRYGITVDELHRYAPIDDERSLLVCLLAFVATGTGGERFVASPRVVTTFAAHFPTRVDLGGTCVRAALAMDRLGLPSVVHLVSIDDDVRRLLPAGVAHVCSAAADSTDPHLIVQFAAGSSVVLAGTRITAAHPNRVILANDVPNELMVLSEQLDTLVMDAPVLLLSGFNTMKDPALVADRLDRLRRVVARMPAGGVVLYEDGGFHDRAIGTQVRAGVAELVELFSMNEDEWQNHLGRTVDLLDPLDARRGLQELQALVPARTLVVHTKFWSVAIGADAARWAPVLRGGITMASTRFCHGDTFTPADHRRVGAGPPHPDGAAFACELNADGAGDLWCEPGLLLEVDHPHTVGLGDSFAGGMVSALVTGSEDSATSHHKE